MSRTVKEKLFDLKEGIKEAYPEFAHGYHFAKLMDNGLNVTEDKGEMNWVGVTDVKGNYFYIRVGADITTERAISKSDCSRSIQEVYPCSLIVVMKGADELKVKDAMVNIILSAGYRIKKQSIDKVAILTGELKGLSKEVIASSIARLKDMVLVKVEFEVLRTFSTSKCKIDICSPC